MKKLCLFLLMACTLSVSLHAQIQIGDAETPAGGRAGKLEDEDVETFKKMTTVFFIQMKDKDRKADFEKVLKEVWTINPFIVATPDEMKTYSDGRKYASFGFGGFVIASSKSASTHLSYDLSIDRYKKNGEQKGRTLLARFILMPDNETLRESYRNISTGNNTKQEQKLMTMFYTTSVFQNWGPGYLKGYALFINNALIAKERRGIFNQVVDKEALANLKNTTLYIPDYTKAKYNAFTGRDKENDEEGIDEELTKAYPYPVAYLSDVAMQQKILSPTEPVYHLQYIRSSTDKYVSIFESKSGKLIYSVYSPISYNFKMKDLKKIAKLAEEKN